ncbi:MAG: hypothetical protein F6K47_14995 [Symploca sp. SIO2E6]|nr:hypothetical protein [Symploca sp. SIO2E6]
MGNGEQNCFSYLIEGAKRSSGALNKLGLHLNLIRIWDDFHEIPNSFSAHLRLRKDK